MSPPLKVTAAPAPGISLVTSYIDNRLDETGYAFNRAILSTETVMPRTLPNSLLAVNASGVVGQNRGLRHAARPVQ